MKLLYLVVENKGLTWEPQLPVRNSILNNKMVISGGDCPLAVMQVHIHVPTHKNMCIQMKREYGKIYLPTLKYKMMRKILSFLHINVLCCYKCIWILYIMFLNQEQKLTLSFYIKIIMITNVENLSCMNSFLCYISFLYSVNTYISNSREYSRFIRIKFNNILNIP